MGRALIGPLSPHGPGPKLFMGRALMSWALLGHLGPHGPNPSGPPWDLMGRSPAGPNGPPWALMGRALMAPPWALMGRALAGWALPASPGPLGLIGWALMDLLGRSWA